MAGIFTLESSLNFILFGFIYGMVFKSNKFARVRWQKKQLFCKLWFAGRLAGVCKCAVLCVGY